MVNWCEQCGYPTVENKCNICGNETKYLSSSIKPVFQEEKVLVSKVLGNNLLNKTIWKLNDRTYWVNGQKINLPYKDLMKNDESMKELSNFLKKELEIMNIGNDNLENFIEGNKVHLAKLMQEANDYINKVSTDYSKYTKVISWSGGKDSTVVSDIVRKSLGSQEIIHVFGDTTLEFPTTREYFDELRAELPLVPFIQSDPQKKFMELCDKFGPPSRVMRWCCSIFKTGPIGQVFNDVFDGGVLTFYGIRRSESSSRSKYLRTTKSPKITKQIVASPIIDWTDFDVWLYIISNNLLINKAYKLGFSRVGCLYCPNNGVWSEFLSSLYFSEEYSSWKEYLYNFAEHIGKPDFKEYIDEGKWKARQGGNGLDASFLEFKKIDCFSEDNAKNYFLNKTVTHEFIEYLKPLGRISIFNEGKAIRVDIYKNQIKWLEFSWTIDSSIVKVKLILNKDKHVTYQRIECQITKFQSCILCSACDSVCPVGAISTVSGYKIDEEKCIHCGKCIAKFDKGCLLSKSLIQSK